jgi:Na+/proline symporter
MVDVNWLSVAIMVFAALPLAVVLATPLWRRNEGLLGNLAGTGVIFGTAVVLILRESAESDAVTSHCLEAGLTDCFPSGTFTRYATYAFIGLAEVIVLFLISIAAERRMRERDIAPEWRSCGRN